MLPHDSIQGVGQHCEYLDHRFPDHLYSSPTFCIWLMESNFKRLPLDNLRNLGWYKRGNLIKTMYRLSYVDKSKPEIFVLGRWQASFTPRTASGISYDPIKGHLFSTVYFIIRRIINIFRKNIIGVANEIQIYSFFYLHVFFNLFLLIS